MTEKYLSTLWNSVAPAAANHLWQSTLVAIAAGLLTLAVRKHHARARYWLWMAASLKFLVPFSLLVALGRYLAWSRPAAPAAQSGLDFVEEITQPFASPTLPEIPHAVSSVSSSIWTHLLPILLVLWFLGFAAVLVLWTVRWRRISAAMKSSQPLSEGREVGALRRIEHLGGIRNPISVLLSRTSLEPGIFGIAHPVLLWPEGISHRLEDAHLEAILTHEVWHVRRRDNLSAALHMLVEAVFWFYPLVWWLGARLVDERERACDEEVLELGGDRQVYAESILKVCEFCLGSPLPCVAGVTGADLKKRMVHIMNDRILHNLGLGRKLLLTTAATLAIAIPVMVGLFTATPSRAQSSEASTTQPERSFETVSVKPSTVPAGGPTQLMMGPDKGTFTARSVTLQTLIKVAYDHVQDSQLFGGPDWLNTEKFDIDATMSPADVAELRKLPMEKKSDLGMLKTLLRDRFKLAVHPELRSLPVYDLVVDENGPKFQQSSGPSRMRLGKGELVSEGTPLTLLTEQLSVRLGRTVVDKTGLKGNYAFSLHWTPDANEESRLKADGISEAGLPPSAETAESIFTAVQEQLGLKLKPQTSTVPTLVIDHAELPSE